MNIISRVWPGIEVEREIGKGSYGTVYKCYEENNTKRLYTAVKVISIPQNEFEMEDVVSEKMTNEQSKAYFKDIADDLVKEIEILKALRGTKNIVEIYDAKIVEKQNSIGWYILINMELLTDFDTYSSDKKFTQEDVIKLGLDLSSALSVCHKSKIIHRDVKPENIFVDSQGNYKLGDFGVAKQMEKTQGSMSVKGTYNYMSPEVFAGKRCDGRADMYSLALVMYKLLNNNRLPFIDPEKQLVRYSERQAAFEKRIKGVELPEIKGVSKELNKIILKACAFKSVDRQKNIDEFRAQLESLNKGPDSKKIVIKTAVATAAATVVAMALVVGLLYGIVDSVKSGIDIMLSINQSVEVEQTDEEESKTKTKSYNQTVSFDTAGVTKYEGKYIVSDKDGNNIVIDDLRKVTKLSSIIGDEKADINRALYNGNHIYYAKADDEGYTVYRKSLSGGEAEAVHSEKGVIPGKIIYADKEDLFMLDSKKGTQGNNLRYRSLKDSGKKFYLQDANIIEGATYFYKGSVIFAKKTTDSDNIELWCKSESIEKMLSASLAYPDKIFFKDSRIYFFAYDKTQDSKEIYLYKYNINKMVEPEALFRLSKYNTDITSESLTHVFNEERAIVNINGEAHIISFDTGSCNKVALPEALGDKMFRDADEYFTDIKNSDSIYLISQEGYSLTLYEVLDSGQCVKLGNSLYIAGDYDKLYNSGKDIVVLSNESAAIYDLTVDGMDIPVTGERYIARVKNVSTRQETCNFRAINLNSSDVKIICEIPNDTFVECLGTAENGWHKVFWNDNVGFIYPGNVLPVEMNTDVVTAKLKEQLKTTASIKITSSNKLDSLEEMTVSYSVVFVTGNATNKKVYTAIATMSAETHEWKVSEVKSISSLNLDIYKNKLDRLSSKKIESGKEYLGYSLFDIDDNGVPELIVYVKDKKDRVKCYFYSFSNENQKDPDYLKGDFLLKDKALYKDKNHNFAYYLTDNPDTVALLYKGVYKDNNATKPAVLSAETVADTVGEKIPIYKMSEKKPIDDYMANN